MTACTSCGTSLARGSERCRACGAPIAPTAARQPGAPQPGAVEGTPPTVPPPGVVAGPPAWSSAPPPAPAAPSGGGGRVLLIAGAVVVLVLVGIGLGVVLAGGSDDGTTSNEAARAEPTIASTSVAPSTVSLTPSTVPTTAASTTSPGSPTPRPGQLYSTYATLRSTRSLDPATEITVVEDRMGARLAILEGPVDGWYRVSVDGIEGWVFGCFVLPSAPGQQVAETRDGERAVLRDPSGFVVPDQNPSGDAVLVIDSASSLWEVLLPDGRIAYVDADEMRMVG